MATTTFNFKRQILDNRGFSSRKINKTVAGLDFQGWKDALEALQAEAWDVACKRYNGTASPNMGKVYEAMKAVYALVGALDNGAVLRCDAGAANTFVSIAAGVKTCRSEALQNLMSKKGALSRELKTLEGKKGIRQELKDEKAAKIAALAKDIEAEKAVEWASFREFRPVSFSTFQKAAEDFLADQIEARQALTSAELKVEKEARKAAKKASK